MRHRVCGADGRQKEGRDETRQSTEVPIRKREPPPNSGVKFINEFFASEVNKCLGFHFVFTIQNQLRADTSTSTSSTIWTLILPFLGSEQKCKASPAFSSENVCDTSSLRLRIPPLIQAIPAGQVSLYLLINLRSV